MKKNVKKIVKNNKRSIIIGAVSTGAAALALGLVKAFKSMKASAKAQHEVDKAEFEEAKAEAKANFEEAKAMGRSETREAIMQEERDEKIAEAKARTEAANARYEAAKKN